MGARRTRRSGLLGPETWWGWPCYVLRVRCSALRPASRGGEGMFFGKQDAWAKTSVPHQDRAADHQGFASGRPTAASR